MVRSLMLGTILVGATAAVAAQTPPAPPVAAAPAAPAAPTAPPAAPAAAPAAPTTPFDALLLNAKPLAADDKAAPERLQSATTANCTTEIAVEHGGKYTIDLKKMQAMAVNTNLMLSGGGKSVQMVFDGKEGAKQAADAEKMVSDLNDKCS